MQGAVVVESWRHMRACLGSGRHVIQIKFYISMEQTKREDNYKKTLERTQGNMIPHTFKDG